METLKTILIADDDEDNRLLLKKFLSDEYKIIEATTGQEALSHIKKRNSNISAVIIDLFVSDMNGYDFLSKIKNLSVVAKLPIIISTVSGSEEEKLLALRNGAWDFITKPYNAETIKFRLNSVIERSQVSAFEQLKYITEYDELTGIYNKNKFYEMTSVMLKSHAKQRFVFIRLDIDRFNLINSFYGTEEGDSLLKFIAKKIRKICKKYDLYAFGRIEADIFAFCIPFDGLEHIYSMIENAKKYIKNFNLEFDIVPTFGICLIKYNSTPVDKLFDMANLAAKHCKGNYFNSYAIYNDEMGESVQKEQTIINEMNDALENDNFCVYLQPKYDLQNDTYIGSEALVRWIHPEKGIIPPKDFIPVFERNGFISKLDYYVWDKVCSLLRKWIDSGIEPQPISVNVSRVNLYNPKFADNICNLLEKYNLPVNLLNLELTESAYTDNPTALIKTMDKLHKHGFVVMMDDFGSGYSSLNILKDVEVDVLKIDMKFLSNTETEGRGENIIASVIRMAKWLKIPTIAEGVETLEQVEFLRGIGCEYVQGYYFSKPMAVPDYEEFTKTNDSLNIQETVCDEEYFDTNSIWANNPHFQKIFSSISQPVAIYEFDGENFEIIRANDAYCRNFGFSDFNYNHKSAIWYVVPQYRSIITAAFNEAVATKGTAECEMQRTIDGDQEIWVNIKVKYVNKIGKKFILLGSLHDITSHKTLDNELQKYRMAIEKSSKLTNKILIVDDAKVNCEFLESIFKGKYEVIFANNGEEALEILIKNDYSVDIVLLDLVMPIMDGKSFLEYRQKHNELLSIPVIIMSDDNSAKKQVEMLSLGSNDYISKPIIPEIVLKRVENVLNSFVTYADMLKNINRFESYNIYDKLTGLCNNEVAKEIINDILAGGTVVSAMILIDINNLSHINKDYGFVAGDEAIKRLSDNLVKNFRKNDIISRYNGDIFLIFISDIKDLKIIKDRLDNILTDIEEKLVNNEKVKCSYSITISDDNCKSFDYLYEKASQQLLEIKNNH